MGQPIVAYDNCSHSGRDRTGIAADPLCPNMAVTVTVNGRGLTLIDLRMPLPLDFIYDVGSLFNYFRFYGFFLAPFWRYPGFELFKQLMAVVK